MYNQPQAQSKRKICVVTGSRAEYGLLQYLMQEIKDDPELLLQVIATGMHLSPEFGLTYKAIEADGFAIDEKVEMLLSSDTPVGIAKSMGLATIGMADALARLQPDILVILGDRFEILAAAQAAMVARIPIAHLHGGEATEGAIDESMRHAITKMSHLHFVAAEPYRKRVVQIGENPEHVYNFGAPGLDWYGQMELLSKEDLQNALGIEFSRYNFLVTYHPETLAQSSIADFDELLTALETFPEATIIFTLPNADADGRHLIQMVEDHVAKWSHLRRYAFTSLGQLRYLSLMAQVDAVIGNSSSGLLEAPLLEIATVNIGCRQKGRLKATSVIDCLCTYKEIKEAIELAISPEFKESLKSVKSLYGYGNASKQIKEVLKAISINGLVQKRFFDYDEAIY